jgi:hypothetical protein
MLRVSSVRIPRRPAVSIVDLSSGGALLELPFAMPPESRFPIELHTSAEHLEVPFQLLRCYVAKLNGGVVYRAAGAFDHLVDLQSLAARAATALQRLVGTLERLLHAGQKFAGEGKTAEFYENLAEALTGLRRGESIDVVTLKVKARLTRKYPSLSITAMVSPPPFDALTNVEGFGVTFRSKYVLSANDRRFLKANAQLISMLEECRHEMRDESDEPSAPLDIICSPAEWQLSRSNASA